MFCELWTEVVEEQCRLYQALMPQKFQPMETSRIKHALDNAKTSEARMAVLNNIIGPSKYGCRGRLFGPPYNAEDADGTGDNRESYSVTDTDDAW